MKKSNISSANSELILNGNLTKAILKLCIPIVINSLIQTMYNLTDTYWLGKIGNDPMAAITLVTPVQNIVVNFGIGITTAGAILISQYIGSGNKKEANKMTGQLFSCSMIFAVVCAAVCFFITPGIVGWMKAKDEIYDLSITYLRIVIMDMPFLFMINIYTAVNQSQGDTVKPMILNVLGILINMVLDPLFMVVYKFGIAGAAWATLLAKVPCAIIAFISLLNKKREIRLSFSGMKIEKDKLLNIVKIGFPTALGGSTMQFGFLLMSRNVNEYGSAAVAAYGIGNRINGIISMPSNAMGSAVGTIVGQNMGAGKVDRVEKTYLIARRIAVIFLLVGGFILSRSFISTSIVKIFSSEEDTIILASEYLSLMALTCFTNGFYNVGNGLLQGTGHTFITMITDVTRLWIFRFLILYICESILNMGVQSIWYAVILSNMFSAFILWILYKTGIWKKNKVKIKS